MFGLPLNAKRACVLPERCCGEAWAVSGDWPPLWHFAWIFLIFIALVYRFALQKLTVPQLLLVQKKVVVVLSGGGGKSGGGKKSGGGRAAGGGHSSISSPQPAGTLLRT